MLLRVARQYCLTMLYTYLQPPIFFASSSNNFLCLQYHLHTMITKNIYRKKIKYIYIKNFYI